MGVLSSPFSGGALYQTRNDGHRESREGFSGAKSHRLWLGILMNAVRLITGWEFDDSGTVNAQVEKAVLKHCYSLEKRGDMPVVQPLPALICPSCIRNDQNPACSVKADLSS